MSLKHKIILKYIKDLSVEIPDAESLIVARERISQYALNLISHQSHLRIR